MMWLMDLWTSMMDLFDFDDLMNLPMEFARTFNPKNMIAREYGFWDLRGDTAAFLALFFDNLATILSLFGPLAGIGFPMDFVYEHFAGGLGLSLFLGNCYYSLQASKYATRTGKMDTVAQPYGVNTPGSIAKTFSIIFPAYLGQLEAGKDKYEAADFAWKVACNANFFGGLIEVIGAFIGPFLKASVPSGAILAPMAGVGITFLGVNPLMNILDSATAKNPIVGFIPLILIWVSYFGTTKLMGPLPAVGMAVIIGAVLNILAQTYDLEAYWDRVDLATDNIGMNGIRVPGFSEVRVAWEEYGSLWLGLAFTNFIGTMSCVTSARKVGDLYSPMETMIVDGVGSMIGAFFGSPYGTTVYIGLVAYKKLGATRGYSVLNGTIWLFIGLFGFGGVIQAFIPNEIVAGVLMVVGFTMAQITVEATPPKWYAALFVGLTISFMDYIGGAMFSPVLAVNYLRNGTLIIMLLYTWFFMMLTDRWFVMAAGILVAAGILSFFGIIHASKINVKHNSDLTLHGSIIGEDDGGFVEANSGQIGWKLWLMYGYGAGLCLGLFVCQKIGLVEPPEEEDYRQKQADEMKKMEGAGLETMDSMPNPSPSV